MNYLLTAHGTLLEAGRDRPGAQGADGLVLFHSEIRSISDAGSLAAFDGPIEAVRQDHAGFVQRRTPAPVEIAGGALAGCRLVADADRGLVTIERDGRLLSAGPSGGAVNWIDGEANDWERFLPVASHELGQLIRLFSSDWVRRSTREMVRGAEMVLGAGCVLSAGELRVPLAMNLPFDDRFEPFQVTVLHEGWRIEELRLFKPLIYYAAYSSPAVHQQLFLSIGSLLEFGGYDGHVHVLTDLDVETVCRNTGLRRDRCSVQRLEPDDFAGYVSSKYCVLEHEPAWQHQPVCYLDPDIVANASIKPMLVEMAISDRITAPVETVGPMRTWPSVGASLIQKDGHNPRFADGFNAGTLGVPNLVRHGGQLRTIRRIIQNLLRLEGREHLEWVDQEVANYVSFRSGHFDTSVLGRFVRYGGVGDAQVAGPLTGLVHFWNTGKFDRHEWMRHYIELLRVHDRSGHRFG